MVHHVGIAHVPFVQLSDYEAGRLLDDLVFSALHFLEERQIYEVPCKALALVEAFVEEAGVKDFLEGNCAGISNIFVGVAKKHVDDCGHHAFHSFDS